MVDDAAASSTRRGSAVALEQITPPEINLATAVVAPQHLNIAWSRRLGASPRGEAGHDEREALSAIRSEVPLAAEYCIAS